jgi:hypothetical protein
MLSDAQKSNIAQWVSEFPRYSHVITDPSVMFIFANDPPPNDTEGDQWNGLAHELARLSDELH